jgi:CRP/FNR family cyclic AMP-dependent transcriptional regulator
VRVRSGLQLRLPAPPLEGAVWSELLASAAVADVAPRAQIPRGGAPPRRIAALLSGVARVFVWAEPRRQVTVEYAGSGQIIGLAGVISGRDDMGAEAVTPCRVGLVSVEHVRSTLARHPEIAWPLVEWAAGRTIDLMLNVVHGVHGPVRSRVARHLLDLSIAANDGTTVAPVTHRQLAEAAGTAREVVTRTLGDLMQMGLVTTGPGHVALLDPEALARLVSGGPPRRSVSLEGRSAAQDGA